MSSQPAEPDDLPTVVERPAAPAPDLDYLRRIYASSRDWYTVAETKAQLLLVANGTFITIVFGAVFGKLTDVRTLTGTFGPETWVLFGLTVVAVVSAVSCAALCLWSLHGRSSRTELARLSVNPGDPDTYRAEALWYFGHLARLDPVAAAEHLRRVDRESETVGLSYHTVVLARRVLRKHTLVNAGWALTAVTLIALSGTAVSLVLRA